jgi:hypothetical protein
VTTSLTVTDEDEFDVSRLEMTPHRRDDRRELVDMLKYRAACPEYALDEVRHLYRYGIRDMAVLAARVGMKQGTLEERFIPEADAADQRFTECLERLIAAGRRFTAAALPLPGSDQYGAAAITVAKNQGRIRAVGKDMTANKVTIWEPTQTIEGNTPA